LRLLEAAEDAIVAGRPVRIGSRIENTDRSAGTLLGHHITRAHGARGLPEDTIVLELAGTAGQSLGAYLPAGVSIDLSGDDNDYVGTGLSGGTSSVHPGPDSRTPPAHNNIAGHVRGYA